MNTGKLCTCEIITSGQMVDDPACPFHHPPAPDRVQVYTDGKLISEAPATKRWRCINCGMEVRDANVIAHADLPTTITLWHKNADGIWCGPIKTRKEGE